MPKLLSNDGSLFVKSNRFSLIPVELSLNNKNDSEYATENEEYSIKIKKHYDLRICPTKKTDSGWYSCYVVKKYPSEKNIKYFTYLDVLEVATSRNDDHDDDVDENEYNDATSTSENYEENYEYSSEMSYSSKCRLHTSKDAAVPRDNNHASNQKTEMLIGQTKLESTPPSEDDSKSISFLMF